eukprot:1114830-Rhodomonas_salina.1
MNATSACLPQPTAATVSASATLDPSTLRRGSGCRSTTARDLGPDDAAPSIEVLHVSGETVDEESGAWARGAASAKCAKGEERADSIQDAGLLCFQATQS